MTDPQKYIIGWSLTAMLIIGLPFWLRQLLATVRGQRVTPAVAAGEAVALQTENRELKAHVRTLEQRLQVLERIATDAPTRLTAEIENLR
jgi:cell division protein FtsB